MLTRFLDCALDFDPDGSVGINFEYLIWLVRHVVIPCTTAVWNWNEHIALARCPAIDQFASLFHSLLAVSLIVVAIGSVVGGVVGSVFGGVVVSSESWSS